MTLAVVGGNSLLGSRFGADAPELTVDDGTSAVVVRDLGDVSRATGGPFAVTWDRTDEAGRRMAPGLYFARITAAGKFEARPIVLVP